MNLRSSTEGGGMFGNVAGMLSQFTSRIPTSTLQNASDGGNSDLFGSSSETKRSLQYGSSDQSSSSTDSMLSDLNTLVSSLISQAEKQLKQMLSQQSSTGDTASDNSSVSSDDSNMQSAIAQLQKLMQSISEMMQKMLASSGSSSGSSTSELSEAMSELQNLLSSLSSSSGSSGTNNVDETGSASSTGGVDGTSSVSSADGSTATAQAMPKDEKDTSVPPSTSTLFTSMDGDDRTADEIIDDNPVLKNLGNQKDINQDKLKEQFGDWTSANTDPKSRALAAKNMSYFLNNVKGLKASDGSDRGDVQTNGKIEGLTKDGDARHGTEAAIVKDVAEQGLDKAFPTDGNLTTTTDKMVNKNGTTKSGFQGICLAVGKALSFLPGLSNVLLGMGNAQSTNPGDVISSGFKGGTKTAQDSLEGAAKGASKGDLNFASLALGAYQGASSNSYATQEDKKSVTTY